MHLIVCIFKKLIPRYRTIHHTTFRFIGHKTLPRVLLQTSETMSLHAKKGLIAVGQMTATNNLNKNLQVCKDLIEEAAKRNAVMVFLPEACDYVGESVPETLALAYQIDGSVIKQFQLLAQENQIFISLGGIHEKMTDEKVRNTHVIISNTGELIAFYRKVHLFDVNLRDKGVQLQESDYVEPGAEIINPVDTPVGKIGLAICYDVRFPEMSLLLRSKGAEILSYPSAFSFATGASHWETLLKCRAVETQCYVVAAAQTGAHNKKRTSYGHAMVVDPWGTVIAQCKEGTDIAVAEIDLDYLKKIRQQMPVFSQRRVDLYPQFVSKLNLPADDEVFEFGDRPISGPTIFYKTALTIAFTNKKCVVPGHVLVCPIRKAHRMIDLSSQEIADLFQVCQKVQQMMEMMHKCTSSTLAIQDGLDAGQTIKHVHVHILPRKKGDFLQNDEIYYKLQRHDKIEDNNPWRTEEDMTQEALKIRSFMKENTRSGL